MKPSTMKCSPLFLIPLALSLSASAAALDTSVFGKSVTMSVGVGKYSGGELANFPVLVRLDKAKGFKFGDFATPVDELRFADANGVNLDFEIDTWDADMNAALVWVSAPTLSSATTIVAYFSPRSEAALPPVYPTNVWTSAGYVGVWHFAAQNADNSYPDASGCGAKAVRIAGGNTPNAPTAATPLANGTRYHVANSVLAVLPEHTASWAFSATGYSVETWLVPTGKYNRMFVQTSSMNGGNAFAFGPIEIYQMSGEFGCYGNWPSAVANQTDWRFVTAVWADSVKSFKTRTCVNGSHKAGEKDKVAVDFSTTGMALTGRNGTDQGSTVLNFNVDEIRIRRGDTSSDWMDANYSTQFDADFFSYGKVQDLAGMAEGSTILLY